MENLAEVRPELQESGTTKLEWTLAFLLLIIPFISFCYVDTASFILYEIRFAQAILTGNLREAYAPIKNILSASGSELAYPIYDLILNLIFGVWGIPLYLYSIRNGTLEITFPQSFWQMLYGKSIFLVALIFSSVMVYKVCCALGLSNKRSGWGAYIYFSSLMTTTVVGIIGQCDVISICVILKGVLEYIRGHHKKFFVWFIFASQFKQFAVFMFIPLLLLTDKNILRIFAKIALLVVITFLCSLPLLPIYDARVMRASFTIGMLYNLTSNNLPLLRGEIPIVMFLLGLLCLYCYFHEYKDKSDTHEVNSQIIFTALTSMVIVFTSFPSYPYWFIHMIPYLAIAAVYHTQHTEKILLFETLGIAGMVLSNYAVFTGCYTPNNSINMLLYDLLGKPELATITSSVKIENLLPLALKFDMAAFASILMRILRRLRFVTETVYVLCMYTILWLSYPYKNTRGGGTTISSLVCY